MQTNQGTYGGDDDLPPTPGQARDPRTGQFAPQQPQTAAAQQPAPQHQHSAYMLAKAQQYGIVVTEDVSPGELDRLLTVADRLSARQTQPTQQQLQKPAPEPEPVIDWGTDDEGKPLAEKDYPKPIARAIKAEAEVARIKKQLAAQDDRWQRAEAERAERAAIRQIHAVMATRPDLFGESPGEAAPGTPEAEWYDQAAAYIRRQLDTGKHTTPRGDAQRFITTFGGAQQQQRPQTGQRGQQRPAVNPALRQYQQAETARASGRRGPEVVDERTRRIELELARQRESNGSVAAVYGDDNSDLPDAPKG